MRRVATTAAFALLAGLACTATGEPLETADATQESVRNGDQERAFRLIQMQTFYSLPESHRAEIIAAAEAQGIELPMDAQELNTPERPVVLERKAPLAEGELDELFAVVESFVDRETFESFEPIHQRALAKIHVLSQEWEVPAMPCFAPGTDPDLVAAFEQAIFGDANAFQQTSRWGSTAMNPGGASQGDPTILTYSFPPDGTSVPDAGFGSDTNQLNAWLDGIYGNRATWRALYDQVFARWGEIGGNTYILEPNDDGATMFNNAGVAGVRGDLRMGAHPLDGNSGVLAFNFFPQNGDMIVDAFDSFYNSTGTQSLRLRNVLAHEHGHGQGQLHVCPTDQTKLMEPFISLAYDGPQFDDTLNAQRHYGDPMEPNDSIGAASPLGSVANGASVNVGGSVNNSSGNTSFVSVDDNGDSDFYEITLTGAGSITATATPLGFSYLEGPQPGGGGCSAGSPYNPLFFGNLRVNIYDSVGTQIASADDTAAGGIESALANGVPGNYYIEVENTGQNNVQAYVLDIEIGEPVAIPLTISASGVPGIIPAGDSADFSVTVTLNDDTIIDGPDLSVTNPGGTTVIPLTSNGGGSYTATIPAQLCGDDPDFFVSVEGTEAGVVTEPSSGSFSAIIGEGTFSADSGDNSIGLFVAGTITQQSAGQWTDGAPEANGRDDPPTDFDGNGLAWFTGQTPGDTNSDVDGGFTLLVSQDYDFSEGGTVSYAYWAADSTNTLDEASDGLRFDVSLNSGGSWTTVRDYGTANAWFTDTIDVGAEVGLSATTRFRWAATEDGTGDVFEAAVDAIVISSLSCTDPSDPCDTIADINGDNDVTPADFSAWIIEFNSQGPLCDQNGDMACTPSDFSAFIINYNAGCP